MANYCLPISVSVKVKTKSAFKSAKAPLDGISAVKPYLFQNKIKIN